MYLRFEDWSMPILMERLNDKGVTHGDKIIKVFATDEDPRITYKKDSLSVVEINDEPFRDEVFDFGERGIFTGQDFEQGIMRKGVSEHAAKTARALARFATREDTRFAYVAMRLKAGEDFLIQHPLDGIDGWARVAEGRTAEESLHLDIFTPTSLGRLRQLVDIDDPTRIMTHEDRLTFRREQMQARRKEVE